ncbi:MAG: SRPBCC domain-containing protein [Pseudomonadota bacterium]
MSETLTVIVEREFAHPPEKIWRALTQPHLIADWLMENDFAPKVGHRFGLKAEWGSLTCEVLEVEPLETLAYTWNTHDLRSQVTWTLAPSGKGTLLRMEQTGFGPNQPNYYHGARAGWPRLFGNLEQVLDRID